MSGVVLLSARFSPCGECFTFTSWHSLIANVNINDECWLDGLWAPGCCKTGGYSEASLPSPWVVVNADDKNSQLYSLMTSELSASHIYYTEYLFGPLCEYEV